MMMIRLGGDEKIEHNSHPSLVAVRVPHASLILHTSSTWWTFLKDILFLTGHHNFQCQKESNLQPTLDLEIMISISFNTMMWNVLGLSELPCYNILYNILALPIFPPRFQCNIIAPLRTRTSQKNHHNYHYNVFYRTRDRSLVMLVSNSLPP